MTVPNEIRLLYEFIEENGFYSNKYDLRHGYLYPENKPVGTRISFFADTKDELKYFIPSFFGNFEVNTEEEKKRLCVFARSCADGSMCALWLDESERTRIVHLGSGSGSILYGVIAENALDFLRLIVIGYDEICWETEIGSPPQNARKNERYVKWLSDKFGADIPKSGAEIVYYTLKDTDSDPFLIWLNKTVMS